MHSFRKSYYKWVSLLTKELIMGVYDKVIKFGEEFGQSFERGTVGKNLMPGPLELFKKDQMQKLGAMMDKNGALDTIEIMGKNYFAGSNIKSIGADAIEYDAPNAAKGTFRKAVAGTAFGLAAANALDINPFGITDQATNLGMLGVHATIGTTLMGMGGKAKVAGIGYLGLTAYNTLLNPGDNAGPM